MLSMTTAIPATTVPPMFDTLTVAMNEAAFVQVGDDVLVEGTREDQELLLIQRDFEGARLSGEGEICLRDGTLIRFLRPAAVH